MNGGKVTSKIIHGKISELFPAVANNVTPESLNSFCDDSEVQVILKWFCDNVTSENVPTKEEQDVVESLKKSGKWFEGEELDAKLLEATKDNPELLELLDSGSNGPDVPNPDYVAENESFKDDLKYCSVLERKYREQRKMEHDLDEELEQEKHASNETQMELEVTYNKTKQALDQLDSSYRNFYQILRNRLEIYSRDGAKKEGLCLWSEMNWDLYIKRMEIYSSNVEALIRKEGLSTKIGINNEEDIHGHFSSSSDETSPEILREVSLCEEKIADGKFAEVMQKADEDFSKSAVEYVGYIYNDGRNIRVPHNSNQLRNELLESKEQWNLLEEQSATLSDKLQELTKDYSRVEVRKFWLERARAKVENRNARLRKLQDFLYLAREQGYVHSDILCILMNNQNCLLAKLHKSIEDSRDYLIMEYKFSKDRHACMEEIRDEYSKILKSFPGEQNEFNRLFIAITDCDCDSDVFDAVQQLESLAKKNKENSKKAFEVLFSSKIPCIKSAAKEINAKIKAEADDGLTNSLKPMNPTIKFKMTNTMKKSQITDSSLSSLRTKVKNIFKEINENQLQREKDTLWQTFLAAPELVDKKYEELKTKADGIFDF